MIDHLNSRDVIKRRKAKTIRNVLLCAILLLLGIFSESAQVMAADAPPADKAKPAAEAKPGDKDEPKEETVVTTHTLTVGGQTIRYRATAGTMLLRREKDGKFEPTASVFYIAYEKLDEKDESKRPLMFSFNGGPGSSSVWMHMGMLGPKRVKLDPEGMAVAPPYTLIDNEYSLLPETDLVFIDPVSTGFSRATPGVDPKQFHGLNQDAESVGEFIRLYATRHSRWKSPKFLIGESYGTTRAAALSGYLEKSLGMNLNGIALISTILNFENYDYGFGNDLPYTLFLPSYAATAWYHKKLPADLQGKPLADVLKEAQDFADGPYSAALRKGDALTEAERKTTAGQLARLTGLSAEVIDESNLRVPLSRFQKELLRDQRRTVGRYDGRYSGIDREAAGDDPEFDPSFAAVQGAFTATFNDYVRDDLNFKNDLPYEILTGKVWPWDFGAENGYSNVAETLRAALAYNPFLKIFVASGYYDLATPFYAAQYTFNHLQLDPSLRGAVSMHYYDAGHMMYLREAELAKVHADLAKFVGGAE